MRFGKKVSLWMILVGPIAVAAVLAAEIWGSMWLTGGIIYIAFVLISLCWPRRRVVVIAGLVASVVVSNHFVTDMTMQHPWVPIIHCTLWVTAMWVTAIMILRRQSAEDEGYRFFNLPLDLLAIFGVDGYMKRVNPAFEQTLGYSSQELTAKPYLDCVHPDDRGTVSREVQKLSSGVLTVDFECRFRHKDGAYRSIAWTCHPLPKEGLFYADGRDITERKRGEEALRRSERIIARSAQATPDLVMVLDLLDSKYIYMNRRAAEFFGLRPDEIELVGMRFFEGRVHPDDILKLEQANERLASVRDDEVVESEYRMKRSDGHWCWFRVRDVVIARTENRLVAEVLCVAADTTERHHADQTLMESEAQLRRGEGELRALAARLITIQEEERKRLARELHDSLSQKLASIAVETSAIAKQSSLALDRVREHLARLPEVLGNLAEEIRAMSHQLHPAILDNVGLAAALETECDVFAKREGISVRFRIENVPPSLPDNVSLCLYRVAQECLSNVGRHARAKQVSVTLAAVEDNLLLSIADSGAGFDPEEARGQGGLGLVSMAERVRLVRGRLSVTSRPGEGTEVEVEVPLAGEAN